MPDLKDEPKFYPSRRIWDWTREVVRDEIERKEKGLPPRAYPEPEKEREGN